MFQNQKVNRHEGLSHRDYYCVYCDNSKIRIYTISSRSVLLIRPPGLDRSSLMQRNITQQLESQPSQYSTSTKNKQCTFDFLLAKSELQTHQIVNEPSIRPLCQRPMAYVPDLLSLVSFSDGSSINNLYYCLSFRRFFLTVEDSFDLVISLALNLNQYYSIENCILI